MPEFQLRKMMLFSETIYHENGPPPASPRRRAAIVAIVANPFAGSWQADLQSSMDCLLYTSPSPRDLSTSRMPSSA